MVTWDKITEEKFQQMLEKVPIFMRTIAQEKITKKIHALVNADGRNIINEKDMVDAFFCETPFGFHGPMKSDMNAIGLNYTQYGYDN
jgi:hypothetical protein